MGRWWLYDDGDEEMDVGEANNFVGKASKLEFLGARRALIFF